MERQLEIIAESTKNIESYLKYFREEREKERRLVSSLISKFLGTLGVSDEDIESAPSVEDKIISLFSTITEKIGNED